METTKESLISQFAVDYLEEILEENDRKRQNSRIRYNIGCTPYPEED